MLKSLFTGYVTLYMLADECTIWTEVRSDGRAASRCREVWNAVYLIALDPTNKF